MNTETTAKQVMPDRDFAALGGGTIVYVKPMKSADIRSAFPEVEIAPGLDLWALVNADGTPLALSEDRDSLVANAWEQQLTTVSLH
jgi:hypothetical protein